MFCAVNSASSSAGLVVRAVAEAKAPSVTPVMVAETTCCVRTGSETAIVRVDPTASAASEKPRGVTSDSGIAVWSASAEASGAVPAASCGVCPPMSDPALAT